MSEEDNIEYHMITGTTSFYKKTVKYKSFTTEWYALRFGKGKHAKIILDSYAVLDDGEKRRIQAVDLHVEQLPEYIQFLEHVQEDSL